MIGPFARVTLEFNELLYRSTSMMTAAQQFEVTWFCLQIGAGIGAMVAWVVIKVVQPSADYTSFMVDAGEMLNRAYERTFGRIFSSVGMSFAAIFVALFALRILNSAGSFDRFAYEFVTMMSKSTYELSMPELAEIMAIAAASAATAAFVGFRWAEWRHSKEK